MLSRTNNRKSFGAAGLAALLCMIVGPVNAESPDELVVSSPHYGEVLFDFYQQNYFTALNKLQVSREFNRLGEHAQEAELLEGGLLLSWGQPEQAAGIFERLLAVSEDSSVRDRAYFYLAKARYQRGYLVEAEQGFLSAGSNLPVELAAERQTLLARIYLEQDRIADAAALLADWQGPEVWVAYARYNLGVAMLESGDIDAAAEILNQVGTMFVAGDEESALRDRANLALGFAYLQQQREGDAKTVLRRISMTGPYSNKALLGAGWAALENDDYLKALGPWQELNNRDSLDSAVQESLLAVPYAYAQLDAEPQAAAAYARALDVFDTEVEQIDKAIAAAGNGRLIEALLADGRNALGWEWQLANLPEDSSARYLYFAIADYRFHQALNSYRGLVALDESLQGWDQKLAAWRGMLATRSQAHADKWLELESGIVAADLAGLQEVFAELQSSTDEITANRDIAALAPRTQQEQWSQLNQLEASPVLTSEAATGLQNKQRILQGLLFWDLDKDFNVRNWRQRTSIDALGADLSVTAERHARLMADARAIPAKSEIFTDRINAAQAELLEVRGNLQVSIQEHADYLQQVAIDELYVQRERLLAYRAQARFALAALYDRMAAKNRQGEVAK